MCLNASAPALPHTAFLCEGGTVGLDAAASKPTVPPSPVFSERRRREEVKRDLGAFSNIGAIHKGKVYNALTEHLQEAPGFQVAFQVKAQEAVHGVFDFSLQACVEVKAWHMGPLSALEQA